jgi:hypothetical protein
VRVSGGELKSVRVGFGWGLERIWCFCGLQGPLSSVS